MCCLPDEPYALRSASAANARRPRTGGNGSSTMPPPECAMPAGRGDEASPRSADRPVEHYFPMACARPAQDARFRATPLVPIAWSGGKCNGPASNARAVVLRQPVRELDNLAWLGACNPRTSTQCPLHFAFIEFPHHIGGQRWPAAHASRVDFARARTHTRTFETGRRKQHVSPTGYGPGENSFR